MQKKLARTMRGFTLMELLMVVAIIAILAAIAIPNLLTAIHRSKQRRTMSDIRNIANAWEARATDVGQYNAAGLAGASQPVAFNALSGSLAPTYIKQMPVHDGWGFSFACFTDQAFGGNVVAGKYEIVSPGRDGILNPNPNLAAYDSFDCDIIYSNGVFLSSPEGFGAR